jgi:hypothetical protein
MSKFTDTLKQALAKKKGQHHVENDDALAGDKKSKKPPVPVITGRPMKKAAGRGR